MTTETEPESRPCRACGLMKPVNEWCTCPAALAAYAAHVEELREVYDGPG